MMQPLNFKMKFFKNIFRAVAFFFFKLAHNVCTYKPAALSNNR